MTILGTLLKNRRAGEAHVAWNMPNLAGSELLTLTSEYFGEGDTIPVEAAGKRVGGRNLSPHLAWSPPPPGTVELLLVVEDIDVPLARPAVHCVALIDPARPVPAPHDLGPGGLSARRPAAGVRVLRSTVGRGYHGPEPIKGHGPHRYTFQLFALSASVTGTADGTAPDRARPRALLSSITAPVMARARLTGVFER